MPIARPGRSSTVHVPGHVPGLARRGLPSLAAAPRRRPLAAGLAMTSLVDGMLVVVLFLLGTAGGDARAADVDRPSAHEGLPLLDAPVVTVKQGAIWLDGRYVGATDDAEATGRVARFGPLADHLRAQHELARTLRPDGVAPSVVVLDVDQDTPAVVVKSLYLTVAKAGYPDVSLLVEHAP